MTQVQTRSGEMQPFDPEKLKMRLGKFLYPTLKNRLNMNLIDVDLIYKKAYERMQDGMTTTALSNLLADVCLDVAPPELRKQHFILARRIVVENNHKSFEKKMVEFVKQSKNKLMFFKRALDFIEANVGALQNAVRHYQDTLYSYKILRQNNISRFQFVLLLLIVHRILTEDVACTEETKSDESDKNMILIMIKAEYDKISQDPKEVQTLYEKWQMQLQCQ